MTIDLARRADAMFEEYSRRLSEFAPADSSKRYEIRLFDRRADYLKLTGDRFSNTGGIFMSGRNLLAAYLEEQGLENLRRTLQHEAFHQFAFTNISPNIPIWLNEGLSQVFEEGIFTGTNFQLGEVPPRRVRQLKYDIDNRRLTPFKQFLSMTDRQWQSTLRDRTLAATQYNQSWAMVQFLVFEGKPGQYKYRALLVEWLKKMHAGADPDQSFKEVFGENIDGFQRRFADWAKQLKPTKEARSVENQNVLADLLIELEQRDRKFESISQFREEILRGRYRIHYTKGEIQWSTAEDPSVYFADLNNQRYQPNQLFFEPRAGAPLPDLVCIPKDSLPLRTKFYRLDGKIERETLVETVKRR